MNELYFHIACINIFLWLPWLLRLFPLAAEAISPGCWGCSTWLLRLFNLAAEAISPGCWGYFPWLLSPFQYISAFLCAPVVNIKWFNSIKVASTNILWNKFIKHQREHCFNSFKPISPGCWACIPSLLSLHPLIAEPVFPHCCAMWFQTVPCRCDLRILSTSERMIGQAGHWNVRSNVHIGTVS